MSKKERMIPEKNLRSEEEQLTVHTPVPAEPTPSLDSELAQTSKKTIMLSVFLVTVVVLSLMYIWGSQVSLVEKVLVTPSEDMVPEVPQTPTAEVPPRVPDVHTELRALQDGLDTFDARTLDQGLADFEAEISAMST